MTTVIEPSDSMSAVTLLLSGSLSQKAVQRFLRSPEAEGCIVVEFDTLHDRNPFPHVGHWFAVSDLIDSDRARDLNEQGRNLLAFFLQERADIDDQTGAADLRKACLRAQDQQIVIPHLVNTHIATKLMERFQIGHIIAASGCGISFSCWRHLATIHGWRVDFLPVEKAPWDLKRRFEKWFYRIRRKVRPILEQPELAARQTRAEPVVVCASERVSRLLNREIQPPKCRLVHVSPEQLRPPTEAQIKTEQRAFEEWWNSWRLAVYNTSVDQPTRPLIDEFSEVILNLGQHYVKTSYPLYLALKKKAVEELKILNPALIISDTQTDSTERVWNLAATELGIPVAAYTYDHFVDPKLTLNPDHLFSDSARGTRAALRKGYSPNRVIQVASHRRPISPNRSSANSSRTDQPTRLQILYSDSFNTTINAAFDLQSSLRSYRLITSIARQLPELRFLIKFHPIRGRKTEQLSFAGMDENDLHFKKQYIRSLKPPANISLLAPEANMMTALGSTSVLLNGYSSTAHEAFQLGIPVIFLVKPDPNNVAFPDIDQFMQVYFANDANTLVSHLSTLMHDETKRTAQIADQRRYLNELYWKSETTLTDAINQLLEPTLEDSF